MLEAVGGNGSPAGSALWYVAGLKLSLREWALRDGWNGKRIDRDEAKGILVAALGMLARYYGYRANAKASTGCIGAYLTCQDIIRTLRWEQ